MTPSAYTLRNFNGVLVSLVVEADAHTVVVLSNKVSFIHAKVWEREQFEHDYAPVRLIEGGAQMILRQFRGYSQLVGMTPEAAVYLPKLIPMTDDEVRHALTQGLATQQRIKKEALKMAQEDNNVSGKAPRKLGGAAAAAVARKEARLAAEAKLLAGTVSEDQKAVDTPESPDAKLPKIKPTGKKTLGEKIKGPAITKDTPKAADVPKILKGKVNGGSNVTIEGEFNAATLKNSDGDWKSASAMFKGLLYEGKLADQKIAEQVDKKFGLGEQKAKDYVKWNRGWFRRQGIKIADSK